MKTAYKLLRPNLTTYNDCQWTVGEWKETTGEGGLCGPGWLHAYTHPLLAVLLNPIHANYDPCVLYRADVSGKVKKDYGLKVGYTRMRITKAVELPAITAEQRVRFAIYLALWAQRWIAKTDRTASAARCAAESTAWSVAWSATWSAESAERSAALLIRAAKWAVTNKPLPRSLRGGK